MPIFIYIYIYICISRSGHCEVLQEILVFKMWQNFQKWQRLQYFFRGFPVLMASSLRQLLEIYPEICIFCSTIQYIVSKKQPVGSVPEVLVVSSETVFDEAHFIVNLHSFPKHSFPPSESFVSHSSRHNNFQNSSPLDTSETVVVCILSSILNQSQANEKNSIIKG